MQSPKLDQSKSKFYFLVQSALQNLDKLAIMAKSNTKITPGLELDSRSENFRGDSLTSEDLSKDKCLLVCFDYFTLTVSEKYFYLFRNTWRFAQPRWLIHSPSS